MPGQKAEDIFGVLIALTINQELIVCGCAVMYFLITSEIICKLQKFNYGKRGSGVRSRVKTNALIF